MRAQIGDLDLEFLRQPQVVCIEERDDLAVCRLQGGIACSRRTRVLLPDRAYPRAELGENRRCFVRGTVVDYDDLERPIRLIERALERLAQITRAVVDGHDDRDEWLAGHVFSGLARYSKGGCCGRKSMRRAPRLHVTRPTGPCSRWRADSSCGGVH